MMMMSALYFYSGFSHIGGVMVSMLASRVVDMGSNSVWSNQRL